MNIPEAGPNRLQFYINLIAECEASLPDRQQAYDTWRNYFLLGTGGQPSNVKQNRVRDKVSMLSSFIYGQEATKFDIKFAANVPTDQKLYAETMREVALDLWHDTDADKVFGDAVTWSLVNGAMLKKVVWHPVRGLETYPLSPGCFGVLREDTDRIQHQEALSMGYFLTKSELGRQLYQHPRREQILASVSGRKKDDSTTIPGPVAKIIISQVSPSMIGSANVDGQGIRRLYQPTVEEELIECRELWVWDDALRGGRGDYRVWTVALPDITIYDRPNFFIPGEHPFVKICPIPIHDYFWGFSLTGALCGLQDWRDKRLTQIDLILERQLRPSRTVIGGNLAAERIRALDSPGGHINISSPQTKVDVYKPDMPEDAWRLIDNIDQQMNEIMGITRTLSGRGEEGVRSEGHAQFLGRMASAPIRKLALIVEDALEDEITLMLKCQAREDEKQYLADKEKGNEAKKFLLSQVSPDYRVRIAAHSSSPIFVEENRQIAGELFKAGAIDKKTLVEMLDPPMSETILARLPALEEAQARVAEMQAKAEMSKVEKNMAQAQQAKAKAGLAAVG